MRTIKNTEVFYRKANSEKDIQKTLVLSQEAHQEGRWSDYTFSVEKRNTFIRNFLVNPGYWSLFVAEQDDEPVGFIYCCASEYLVGTDFLMTTVYAYYVRKQWRQSLVGGKIAVQLMKNCIRWSKSRNSREILIHATSGIDMKRTDIFLRRTGFKLIGGNYSLDMSRL